MANYHVGLLVISTKSSADTSLDKTTSSIETFFRNSIYSDTYQITHKALIPDDFHQIQSQVTRWTDSVFSRSPDLILTSGGTGFSIKDITPEAVEPLLQKKASGIVHAMLKKSFEITPYAMMARPIAGVRNQSLIVTLPGSPKGAVENLDAILPVLDHALDSIRVDGSRELHDTLKKEGKLQSSEQISAESSQSHSHSHSSNSHSHSHSSDSHSHTHSQTHHHTGHQHGVKRHILSNDLSKPLTTRARESPYPMIPMSDALSLINKHTPSPEIITKHISDPSITGYVLAEDVIASTNVPNFRASIVDGYAVIHTDGPGVYKITQVSHASPSEVKVLTEGFISRVTTGAPIPNGSTAVVPVEETELISTKNDGEEEDEVKILALDIVENDNVREIGSDIKEGDLALRKGTQISQVGGEIALLTSIGVEEIRVYRKPLIGVLSTGDELVDFNDGVSYKDLKFGEIFDTNRPLLLNLLRNWGYEVLDLGIARDTSSTTERHLKEALFEKHVDYVITTGGVSMGELDLLKPTIEQRLEGTIHFGRVAMKPGKPATFATIDTKYNTRKVIFALPGNPASASVTSHLFVLPSLRKFSGVINPEDPDGLPSLSEIDVVLKRDVRLDPRPEYQRVFIHQEGSQLVAESTGFQRSSRVGSVSGANGLLVLPSIEQAGGDKIVRGSVVKAIVITIL